MRVLGIYDSHNAGASLIVDGKVVAAIEEERLTRNKIEFGFPSNSINEVLRITGLGWEDVDAIAVPGLCDPPPWFRWKTSFFKFRRQIDLWWRIQYAVWRLIFSFRKILLVRRIEEYLNKLVVAKKISNAHDFPSNRIFLVDHHVCHAASAYRTSGLGRALVITIDGSGDGYSTVVYKGGDGNLEFIAGASEEASLGKLYSNVTLGLGFKKLSDEGKVMGLAACGNPDLFYPIIDEAIRVVDIDRLHFEKKYDLVGNGFARLIKNEYLKRFTREDIAAATQRKFEETVIAIVKHFVDKTGIRHVVFAGGAASNVLMNQKVRELDIVDGLYVFPNMGDGGLSAGAALEVCYWQTHKNSISKIDDVYWGPEYSNEEIREAISRNGLKADWVDKIDDKIAGLICEGYLVARVQGRMEFGPRALGNRSVLALPSSREVVERINKLFKRDEFMPFAPSILEDCAPVYLEKYSYSPFMVETFSVKREFLDKFPAVIHVDGTLRPQVVRREVNPGYWNIIKKVGDISSFYIVLNTSYNMHGEPIVCSPQDAINTFLASGIDYLALGNYLLSGNQVYV
ncbi:MAG: hypothetical protein HY549_02095 [Elusimicrobia bacterium]|nr:hypothetical protein [Elusimicrobiota bacterium]